MPPESDEIVIDRVDLAFEVEGDDRAVFERYFAECMRRWQAEHDAREARARRSARERRLGGGRRWGDDR